MINKIEKVAVYCASSSKVDAAYLAAATELGELLAQEKMQCIYGAGNQGLMGYLADSVLRHGGEVVGVIPQFMCDEGWCHPTLSQVHVVESMHQRKALMLAQSDATIALPGGCGTLEELLECITWKQLGLYHNPIVVLNTNGYFDPLLQMLTHATDEQFMRPEHLAIWQVVSTPQEAIEAIRTAPIWSGEQRKWAAI